MSDRSNIKWAPFNSVIAGTEMISDVLKKKNIKKMPILSEDQLNTIENKILNSYNNQTSIKIKYFRNGNYYLKEGKIRNIDINNRKITLNNDFNIYFSQIIEIN